MIVLSDFVAQSSIHSSFLDWISKSYCQWKHGYYSLINQWQMRREGEYQENPFFGPLKTINRLSLAADNLGWNSDMSQFGGGGAERSKTQNLLLFKSIQNQQLNDIKKSTPLVNLEDFLHFDLKKCCSSLTSKFSPLLLLYCLKCVVVPRNSSLNQTANLKLGMHIE